MLKGLKRSYHCCNNSKIIVIMKAPKKPTYKALPKAPKMSASKESWKKYESKVKAINAENQKRKSEYEKKLRAYESEIKDRQRIKENALKAKTKF